MEFVVANATANAPVDLRPYVDVFVIVGQSNAEGRGSSASSPSVVSGLFISGSTITYPLADPVGGALTGSMWPAFANRYFAEKGRMAAFVEAATGGTGLLPDQAGSNWSPSGTLRAAAVSAANAAIAALDADPRFRRGTVRLIWSQGENDAQGINGATITGALYETALESLADYFAANVTDFSEMLVVRTGRKNDTTLGAEYAEIRAAQDAACVDSANLRMVYRGASGFAFDGRNIHADANHWNQTGLNEAGTVAAITAATTGDCPVPTVPALLASAAFADTDTTTATSRTISHTPHANTQTLVVAVGVARVSNNTTNSITSVTFGGVTMKRANAATNTLAGGNPSPAGRVDIGIYYLTEAMFGGDLGAGAADIVITPASSCNIISAAALDLDAPVIQECGFGGRISSTTGTVLNAVTTTGAPVFAVGLVASAGDSAAAIGCTFTGLTEIMDDGGSTGTRAGQVAVGHATLGEVTEQTISATLANTVSAAAFTVACFRGVLPGENPSAGVA